MTQDEKIKRCLKELIDADPDIFDYATPKGLKELRSNIANYLGKKLETPINPSHMLITSGSQQSIYLLSRILSDEKETILSEEPTYFGAIQVFKKLGASIETVKVTDEGLDLDELKRKVAKKKPNFIYVVPTFHNPTGISWSEETRKRFLKIINDHNIAIIEDDPYSEFYFSEEKPKSLYQLNKGKNIIYLGTFSKILCPSLSVGYILAEKENIDRLYEYKLLNDMNTSLFIQKFINLYLAKYDVDEDIAQKRELLKEKARSIKKRLKSEFEDASFSDTKGGLFMTVHLPGKKIDPTLYTTNYFEKSPSDLIRINVSTTDVDTLIKTLKNLS